MDRDGDVSVGGRRRRTWWAALTMACLVTACRPGGGGAPQRSVAPRVDGAQALARVAELVGIGPRPTGSDGARRAAEWLEKACRDLGYVPETDTWEHPSAAGTLICRNVLARLSGAAAAGRTANRVILGSHYDTKRLDRAPGFVGANDSGSSTGLLLEIMRVLKAQPGPLPFTFEFMFFDGEECVKNYTDDDGLLGSRRAAARMAAAGTTRQYAAMLLLDMVGDRDLTISFPPDGDPHLLRRALALSEGLGVGEKFSLFTRGTILDDHTPFQSLGIPVLNFIDFSYGPGNSWWHTEQDTLDKLSADSLATVGNVVLALLWDLSTPPPPGRP